MTRRASADQTADHDRDLRKHDIKIALCCFGHCARKATCYDRDAVGGYRCDEHSAERNATVAEPLRSIINAFSAGVDR